MFRTKTTTPEGKLMTLLHKKACIRNTKERQRDEFLVEIEVSSSSITFQELRMLAEIVGVIVVAGVLKTGAPNPQCPAFALSS